MHRCFLQVASTWFVVPPDESLLLEQQFAF
jgi:hypothetical protein